MLDLKALGRLCKRVRVEHGYRQIDVASATGYGVENISSFENGRNDNSRILLWYLMHGLKAEDIQGV